MYLLQKPIVVSATFSVSKEILWKAVTEVSQMQQWFFKNIPSFKAKVGFQTQFLIQNEDRKFTHVWKILEVEPFQKITYNWHYTEYQGDSIVSFELEDTGGKTKLKVTHQITEPFVDDIVEFKRESGVAGWTFFIETSLKNFLKEK